MAKGQDKTADRLGATLLEAAFEEIALAGWDGARASAIAARAQVSLVVLYRHFPSRASLLKALTVRVDEAMLGVDPAEFAGLPPRDCVFELMMQRYDALAPFRPGLARLAREGWSDPALVLGTACRLDRSLAWLQEAAGLGANGLRARLARRALAYAYLRTFDVWLKDDSSDLAKTMAALDKALRAIETLAGLRDGRAGPSTADEAAPAPA